MRMIVLVYVVAFLLASIPLKCQAFDYDVDWPTSGNGKHALAITIDGCETRFIVEDKNLEAFKNKIHDDEEERLKVISAAIKRAKNGCK